MFDGRVAVVVSSEIGYVSPCFGGCFVVAVMGNVSHGFGGIDGGVTMSVHGSVGVEDLFMENNPDPHKVTFNAEVVSAGRSQDAGTNDGAARW